MTGWFTIGDLSGPKIHHVPIHNQLQQRFSYDSACLLLFHPSATTAGGKLPLTLYEAVVTGENTTEMDTAEHMTSLKFRELSYAVETGEAEMISVDFVAKGGGNATAVEVKDAKDKPPQDDVKGKGKAKAKAKETDKDKEEEATNGTEESYLSPEDDESMSSLALPSLAYANSLALVIASLTAKANAVKMLHARINLLKSYLSALPPSYLTEANLPISSDSPNHQILRSILALQARIPLLIPPDTEAFKREALEQTADTALVQLLSSITSGVYEASEMGRKHTIVDNAKTSARMQDRRGGPRGMDVDPVDLEMAGRWGDSVMAP